MKLKFIYFLGLCLFVLLLNQSSSSGVAASFNQDRTGSPTSLGTCNACHSGGSFGAGLTIVVKNSSNIPVTTYTAGQVYTLEYTVSGSGSGYGVQGVGLLANNTQGGTLSSPNAGSRISILSGRQYLEHATTATTPSSHTFSATWTAPSSGSGSVTFYGSGIVANRNGGTSGDNPIAAVSMVLNEQVATTISYSNSTYCQNNSDPIPTVTGQTGGTVAASPAGLIIDPSTGTVDVSASSTGNYVVTYTYSGGTATTNLVIQMIDDASFAYANASYCVGGSSPTPTITGQAGGAFTANPVGLIINGNTGQIDLANSTAGNYTVTYVTNGNCPNSSNQNITIQAADNASFAYANTVYCMGSTINPVPTITGQAGGVFAANPVGLSLNGNTGQIDLANSIAGNYTVTYTTNGNCPNSSAESIVIQATDDASFAYADSSYCNNSINPTPTITGQAGGAFTANPVGLSIDGNTGQIDLLNSIAGSYTVVYTTSGNCPSSSVDSVTILEADNASFLYADTSSCADGANPSIILAATGTGTGIYTAMALDTFISEPLIFIDSTTGEIALTNYPNGVSPNGDYTITFTSEGNCPTTSSTLLTVFICAGVDQLEGKTTTFKLYPNPNKGVFQIERQEGLNEEVVILVQDLYGKLVYQTTTILPAATPYTLTLDNLPSGVYLVQLQGQKTIQTQKVRID